MRASKTSNIGEKAIAPSKKNSANFNSNKQLQSIKNLKSITAQQKSCNKGTVTPSSIPETSLNSSGTNSIITNTNESIDITSVAPIKRESKIINMAPTINIDLEVLPMEQKNAGLNRYDHKKSLPSSKNLLISSKPNTLVTNNNTNIHNYNSFLTTSVKNDPKNTRNLQSKAFISPNMSKVSKDKHNMRYNSNSYSSSFCQALTMSSNKAEKFITDGTTAEVEETAGSKNDSKVETYFKNIVNTKGSSIKTVIESYTSAKPAMNQFNKTIKRSYGNTSINHNINRDSSSKPSVAITNNNTEIFLAIFQKMKNLIVKTMNNTDIFMNREKFNSINSEIERNLIFKEIDDINREISNFIGLQKNNVNLESNQTFYAGEYESTKFNINLIKSASDRRYSLYKNSFDQCLETMREISIMISKNISNANPQDNQNILFNSNNINIPFIVENQNITNNIINNITNNNSKNVNVNLNVNVNTISNISSKESHNNKKLVSKLASKRRISKARFNNSADCDNEEFLDEVHELSNSLICEGVRVDVPFRNYKVNKPKDSGNHLKILTECNSIDSEFSNEGSSESGKFPRIDYDTRGKHHKEKKQFQKIRSRSLLNVKKRKQSQLFSSSTEKEDRKLHKPNEIITLLHISSSQSNLSNDSDEFNSSVSLCEIDENLFNDSNKSEINSDLKTPKLIHKSLPTINNSEDDYNFRRNTDTTNKTKTKVKEINNKNCLIY